MNIALTITNHVKYVNSYGCGSVIGTWHGKNGYYTANIKGRIFEATSFDLLEKLIYEYIGEAAE